MDTTGRKFLARFDVSANSYKPLVWHAVIVAEDGSEYRWLGWHTNDSLVVESLSDSDFGQTRHLPITYFPNLAFLTLSF